MINATCAHGFNIILSIENDLFILDEDPKHEDPPRGDDVRGDYMHGCVTKGSMNLTADEAEVLACKLSTAAKQARQHRKLAVRDMIKLKTALAKTVKSIESKKRKKGGENAKT